MDLAQFEYYTDWHAHANQRQYEAPADPWRLVYVDTSSIERYNTELPLNWGLGRVEGGDWDSDEYRHPLEETVVFRGLRQRFEQDAEWEETALYQWAVDRFDAGETVRGYERLSDFRDVRLPHIDDLFHSIREDAYRPNRDATHEPASDDNPLENAYANRLEPLVLISRTGELLLTEGFHRVAITSILDVGSIPVLVLCRHADWQKQRDAVQANREVRVASPHGTTIHPDLEDCL